MILAAGLGTRLRPLTNERPKALVEVGGKTLLEITLARLRQFGVAEVIINVHHFPDLIAEYLKKKNDFGMKIALSREDVLLDTGGGLKKAAWFFAEDAQPFLVHNVDVLSNIALAPMVKAHEQSGALATLAAQDRQTSRYLLFDDQLQLCGRRAKDGAVEIARPAPHPQALAFCGVHVISPRLLKMLTEDGVFSIITSYLRLATAGEKIAAFRADGAYWRDLGKPESLAKAEQEMATLG